MDRATLAISTAHVIGGGPSAQRLNFSLLTGRGLIIGVNDSFFNTPCDVALSIDGRWMSHRWERLKAMNATAWLREDSYKKHVGNRSWPGLTLGECKVFEPGPGPGLHCLHGNNSGLVALHYAYHLGFQRIFLYGFDMGFEGSKKHWYNDYEWLSKGRHMYPAFAGQFSPIAGKLKSEGRTVFNVSPSSRLDCFPKLDFSAAIRLLEGS